MNTSNKYFGKYLFLVIPLVAIILVGLFLISYNITDLKMWVKLTIHSITMTAGIWLGCIGIVTYLWKKFPWEEKPLLHLLIELVLILTYTTAFSFLLYNLENKFWELPKVENIRIEIFLTIVITLLITAIHESVFFYRQWKYNFSKSIRLEKDNIEANYEALKSQINPHFLFNSLNGIVSLASGNNVVIDYVQNLSDILRYMLKNRENELVTLSEEIEITKCYINLNTARFKGSLNVSINIKDDDYNSMILPLVLQMLVDNCLKHNIISRDKPLNVSIETVDDYLVVRNNLQRKNNVLSTGNGLKNIAGRYGYFTKSIVFAGEENGNFVVKVPLLKTDK